MDWTPSAKKLKGKNNEKMESIFYFYNFGYVFNNYKVDVHCCLVSKAFINCFTNIDVSCKC